MDLTQFVSLGFGETGKYTAFRKAMDSRLRGNDGEKGGNCEARGGNGGLQAGMKGLRARVLSESGFTGL